MVLVWVFSSFVVPIPSFSCSLLHTRELLYLLAVGTYDKHIRSLQLSSHVTREGEGGRTREGVTMVKLACRLHHLHLVHPTRSCFSVVSSFLPTTTFLHHIVPGGLGLDRNIYIDMPVQYITTCGPHGEYSAGHPTQHRLMEPSGGYLVKIHFVVPGVPNTYRGELSCGQLITVYIPVGEKP